jgi:hypothetical protein
VPGPYRLVGAAVRQSLERARKANITASEWKVLSVVIDLTASLSKMKDTTWNGQIATEAGFGQKPEQVKRAGRTLRKLRQAGVILYEPGSRKRWTVVGLPPPEAGY